VPPRRQSGHRESLDHLEAAPVVRDGRSVDRPLRLSAARPRSGTRSADQSAPPNDDRPDRRVHRPVILRGLARAVPRGRDARRNPHDRPIAKDNDRESGTLVSDDGVTESRFSLGDSARALCPPCRAGQLVAGGFGDASAQGRAPVMMCA
jgi:hypothetical protein